MEFDRDQATGDYIEDDSGRPQMTSNLGPAVRTLLRTHRKQWLYAPDSEYGSDFHLYKKRKSVDFTDGIGESIAGKALDRLGKDGRADNIEVATSLTQRGGVAFAITLLDRKKRDEYTVTTPIGVP